MAILGAAASLVLVAGWVVVDQSDGFLYRGGLTLHALLVVTVIAAALVPGPVRSALAIAPLRALGLVSYGAYLYHWPIFLWLSPARSGLDGAPLFGLRLAVTLAVASISWYYLEQPILHGRRITGWRPALVAPATAAAVAVLFVTLPGAVSAPSIVFSAVHRPAAALAAAPGPPPPTVPPAPAAAPARHPAGHGPGRRRPSPAAGASHPHAR